MDDLKKIGENKWWDADAKTLYVRAPAHRKNLPGHIADHREELSREPDNFSTRYLLGTCLYADGQMGTRRGRSGSRSRLRGTRIGRRSLRRRWNASTGRNSQ